MNRTVQERDQLIASAMNAAEACVKKFVKNLPDDNSVDHEELRAAAMAALVQSANRFDETRGVDFVVYAWTRMTGAMADEMRAQDPVSRSTRKLLGQAKEATCKIEQREGRAATVDDLCVELGVTRKKFDHARLMRGYSKPARLDEVATRDGDGEALLHDLVADANAVATLDQLVARDHDREEREQLYTMLAQLPERERLVIVLLFYEGMSGQQVADVIGVTESRVSQMKTRALSRMRAWANELQRVPQPAVRRAAA